MVPVFDEKDEYIPPEQRSEESHLALVLIRWDFITMVIQFPDRQGWRAGADESDIGFRPPGNGDDKKEEPGG